MRLVVLSVVGFGAMVVGLVAAFALAFHFHLSDTLFVPVIMFGGFGLAIAVVIPTARWLERNDPLKLEPAPGARPLVAPEAVGPAAASAPETRSLPAQIRDELLLDRPVQGPGLATMLVLGGVFAVTAGVDSLREALVLVAVVFFHELGHLAAMRAVGYRDVRIFFIPFFGAVTVGRSEGLVVAPWKRLLVSLAGPVPGLILVGVALVLGRPEGLAREALWLMLLLNTFNLLPLGSLDGGRVVGQLVAERVWALEVTFVLVSGLSFLALGWVLRLPLLAVLGAIGLASLPRRKLTRALVTELRSQWLGGPTLVATPAEIPEPALASLAARLDPVLAPAQRGPVRYAAEIRDLWELASQPQGSWLASVALLSVYGVACLGALVAVVLWSVRVS